MGLVLLDYNSIGKPLVLNNVNYGKVHKLVVTINNN